MFSWREKGWGSKITLDFVMPVRLKIKLTVAPFIFVFIDTGYKLVHSLWRHCQFHRYKTQIFLYFVKDQQFTFHRQLSEKSCNSVRARIFSNNRKWRGNFLSHWKTNIISMHGENLPSGVFSRRVYFIEASRAYLSVVCAENQCLTFFLYFLQRKFICFLA